MPEMTYEEFIAMLKEIRVIQVGQPGDSLVLYTTDHPYIQEAVKNQLLLPTGKFEFGREIYHYTAMEYSHPGRKWRIDLNKIMGSLFINQSDLIEQDAE